MNIEATIEEETQEVKMKRPHLVLLGAGASRAACLEGDKHGRTLPLMKDLIEVVGLESLFESHSDTDSKDFESVFSELYENNESRLVEEIESSVTEYFTQLEIPDKPTIYDYLVLSLRRNDVIATFNWDPLLLQAYVRNGASGVSMPKLLFLHGNVMVGYCDSDKVSGIAGQACRKCGKPYTNTPLLYPIRKKNYANDTYIESQWEQFHWSLKNAFMITIFGYSAPKTDTEAISAMQAAWGDNNQRDMEQTAFISTQSEDEIVENWKSFIHTHHYEVQDDFFESWIYNHPRRTGEAYLNQYLEARFIQVNPAPREVSLAELWAWFERFKPAENA